MLNVNVQNFDDRVILNCEGEIVNGSETAILCAAVHQHGRNVSLDLSRVEAIDRLGIAALVSLQAAGIYIKLINPGKRVRELLRASGAEKLFEILMHASALRSTEWTAPELAG